MYRPINANDTGATCYVCGGGDIHLFHCAFANAIETGTCACGVPIASAIPGRVAAIAEICAHTSNPHYACDTHGAVCPTGEHTLHTPANPCAGCDRCDATEQIIASGECPKCRADFMYRSEIAAHLGTCTVDNTITPGTHVTFADPPACFADLRGVVCTVETVTYGLGGMMSADDRAAIAAGHAHLIMTTPTGRRIGTTANRITR